MIFVLKFGAWRMSVFATDRRYSDNGILVSSSLAVLTREAISKVTSIIYYILSVDIFFSRILI